MKIIKYFEDFTKTNLEELEEKIIENIWKFGHLYIKKLMKL